MNMRKKLFWLLMALSLAGCRPSAVTGMTPTPGPGTPSVTPPTAPPAPTFTPTPTPTPAGRILNGDQALFYGDFTAARDEYRLALANSGDAEIQAAALWGLGRVEYEDGNLAASLEILRQLTAVYPDSVYAAYGYFLMGDIYMELERFGEAADSYAAYLARRPGVIDTYAQERRGDALARAGDHPGAIAAYQAAVSASHLENLALETKLAQAYAAAGDTNTAIAMYDNIAARSTDEYTPAQMDFLIGQIYLQRGQNDLAYERFRHAVDNYPRSYDSYSALVALVNAGVPVDEFNRGLVDYFAGQYGYALIAFDNYLAANPQHDGTVYYYRALSLERLGRYSEAVDELTYFIQNYSSNPHWQTAWEEKAYLQWAYLGQYPQAAQTMLDYASAAPTSPAAPQAMLSAGRILERDGRLAEAAAVWERIGDAYASAPEAAQGLFWAGIARYRLGDYNAALLAFHRSLQASLTPEDQARAYFWIGKSQQILGDAAAAQAAFQQAAAIDPLGYYGLRSRDMLWGERPFQSPPAYDLSVDWEAERREAEAWLRITFGLPPETDLSGPGALFQDPRLSRGTELWRLGLYDEARLEFENLRAAVAQNPADCYRLMNYLLDLGMYRTAIFLDRQILTLAGMETQASTLAAPRYFQHIRYGTYYREIVVPAAERYGFHPLFLYAVIRQESLFEGYVRSSAGARGLMQIIPTTGATVASSLGWPPDYTDQDLYRPQVSITLGTHYLASNRDYFGGDLYAALAAYNSGPGNAAVWADLAGNDPDLFVEVIRYQETRLYLRSIYELYGMYRSLYGTIP
ncbi:MAG: tetratricopeptide repeat protein [Anaerolineales bacterium]